MRTIQRSMIGCVAVAVTVALASETKAGLVVSPSITLLSNSLETETEAIGGGGSTPFVLGPNVVNSNNLFINTANNALDTGFQPAGGGTGSGRGFGTAIGDDQIDVSNASISGSLQSIAGFEATPALGSGLGQSDATIRIVFRPTVDTNYTLDASLTPVVGGLGSFDVFSIRRTNQLGSPIVHLISNALPADIVGATGTFFAGLEYTLLADLSAAQQGGNAQSPGNAETLAAFNLVFETGTQFGIGGDLNGDGFVGIDDLNLVLGNWNQNVPPGNPLADPNGDGFVGIDDLNEVLSNWNRSFPQAPSSAVPEPASLCMVTCLAIGTTRRTRK